MVGRITWMGINLMQSDSIERECICDDCGDETTQLVSRKTGHFLIVGDIKNICTRKQSEKYCKFCGGPIILREEYAD